jgi:hypothetical protein
LDFTLTKPTQHGLAISIAYTYDLDEFRGFSHVMHAEGVQPQGQLPHQAGVMDFSDLTEARNVMKISLALCV